MCVCVSSERARFERACVFVHTIKYAHTVCTTLARNAQCDALRTERERKRKRKHNTLVRESRAHQSMANK